ncbi:MAG TPA: RNA-binding cell elongation regulator Jag/EloR [Actinomycetota bacterium]|nr:RNA-binding cell elongation regulator Jag/EloR [Actinomycetota bacterium]
MREVEKSAASVEEAIEAALEELGISEQEAEIEIVQEPQKGLLGIGSQRAIIRVKAPDEGVGGVALEEQAEVAQEFLTGLLERMGIPAEVDRGIVEGVMYLDVLGGEEAESMGVLIGRHGQTLDALQEVVRTAVQRKMQERCRVVVDVEDYRKRRKSQLAEKTRSAADRVRRTGRPERMEPMSPYERKIVHDAAGEVGGVETASEGEEPERRVVIRKKGGRGAPRGAPRDRGPRDRGLDRRPGRGREAPEAWEPPAPA